MQKHEGEGRQGEGRQAQQGFLSCREDFRFGPEGGGDHGILWAEGIAVGSLAGGRHSSELARLFIC